MPTRSSTIGTGKVAEELGIARGTVLRWVMRGYIKARRLPSGVLRFERSDVDRLLRETATDARAAGAYLPITLGGTTMRA